MKLITKLHKITNKRKRLDFIIKNKESLLREKKAIVKEQVKGLTLTQVNLKKLGLTDKSNVNYKLKDGEAIVNFIGNTYLWLDNHEDVHDKSVFKKTIKERKRSIFHLADHNFGVLSKVGEILDIREVTVKWGDLGIDKEGETQVLLITSVVSKIKNPAVYEDYVKNRANQHSVGMWYVELKLAIDDAQEKNEYALFNKYINKLGNQEKAEELGYFYLIKEAGLREISYVLLASNEITPTTEVEEYEEEDEDKKRDKSIMKFLNM